MMMNKGGGMQDSVFYQPIKAIPMPPDAYRDSSMIKLAVNTDIPDCIPQLIIFDQKRPLAAIVEDLCSEWKLSPSTDYGLKFTDPVELFLTEKNRMSLQNGTVLKLTLSATKLCENILNTLHGGNLEDKANMLQLLAKLATDLTFALEFFSHQGLDKVMKLIEANTLAGSSLTNLLRSFAALMDHGQISWDVLSEKLVTEVASFVVGRVKMENQHTLTAALAILEAIIGNSTRNLPVAEREVPIESLIRHLDNSDPQVQQNALALMNALFIKAQPAVQKSIAELMNSKAVRTSLLLGVFGEDPLGTQKVKKVIGAEMGHQLYVLQTLLMNMLDERRLTRLNSAEPAETEKVHELRKIAFETSLEPLSPTSARKQQANQARDFKKLGFANYTNPSEEFKDVPPGILALDCMLYFAKQHNEAYTRIVLENSCRSDNHECPFAQTCCKLTKLLTEILEIGEPPSETGEVHYQMFFKHEQPFMEFFAICVKLVNKTWREMHATIDDIDKVFSVVREQVVRSLAIRPKSFGELHDELNRYTYYEIQNIWQQERNNREEHEFQARPILELRDQLKPEILNLVRLNRLNCLKEGKIFTKYGKGFRGAREKGKFWFWALSPNDKTFCYDDSDDKQTPSLEDARNKLSVSEIVDLVVGKECPHMKDPKNKNLVKTSSSLAFSILVEGGDGFNFVADNEATFNIWTDGINALLGKVMTSKQALQDVDMLLNLEVKIRLLEVDGLVIPNEPPPIPPPPPNLDFCYDIR